MVEFGVPQAAVVGLTVLVCLVEMPETAGGPLVQAGVGLPLTMEPVFKAGLAATAPMGLQ